MISLANTTTRFGRGVGLLWRGINLKTLNSILFDAVKLMLSKGKFDVSNRFLFESARSAIFHALDSIGVVDPLGFLDPLGVVDSIGAVVFCIDNFFIIV